MNPMPADIFSEPTVNPDTLRNLGPLAALAGQWTGKQGVDVHPTADGPEEEPFVEHYDLQPIDAQTNGPQLFYGLRYHTHVTRPGQIATFHDQVGYWLWEPATGTVSLTLAIPRAQVALATGPAAADARRFTVRSQRGSLTAGIVSNPFLEYAFQTPAFEMTVTLHANDTWSYEQTTTLLIRGQKEPFLHTDRNTLTRVSDPKPNPLAVKAALRKGG